MLLIWFLPPTGMKQRPVNEYTILKCNVIELKWMEGTKQKRGKVNAKMCDQVGQH